MLFGQNVIQYCKTQNTKHQSPSLPHSYLSVAIIFNDVIIHFLYYLPPNFYWNVYVPFVDFSISDIFDWHSTVEYEDLAFVMK
jgi:hypothetical protein